MDVHAFLTEVGRRLRSAREAAHKTVTEAAADAGVSRRHWTETEAGRANPSLLVLARQSAAVRIPLSELVQMPWRLHAPERFALVGLRGAGKSTVGRALAQALEVPFVELDRRVESLAGLSLAEIFDLHGAEVFRRFEAEALEAVLGESGRAVIATGGSIVSSSETFERLRDTCRTVWLSAEPEEHFRRVLAQGDRRPMGDNPRAMEELRAILARRAALYARCDLHIDTTSLRPDEIVERIVAAGSEDARTGAGVVAAGDDAG